MQSYSVSIIAGAFERRKNNSGLLHGFTGFLLVLKTMDWVRNVPPDKQWPSFFFLGAGLVFALFGLTGKRIILSFSRWSKILFLLEGLCFLILTMLFLPAGKPVDLTFTIAWTLLCVFFYYSEKRIEGPAMVSLTETGVLIPGIIKNKLIPWQEIESVVLRSDFLTINKKNNRYYQFEVAEEDGESFREAFNLYAQSKIE